MNILDAFQGYHHIAFAFEDQEKTSSIALEGNYHYTVKPFVLKNARATYQRMITRMFKDQIRKIVEVYINDMVVKTKKNEGHVRDLVKVFEILRQHKLFVNVDKMCLRSGIR